MNAGVLKLSWISTSLGCRLGSVVPEGPVADAVLAFCNSVSVPMAWHGVEPNRPDFSTTSRVLAYTLDGRQTGRELDCDFYVAINGAQTPNEFQIPTAHSEKSWRRVVDTSRESPNDFIEESKAPAFLAATYELIAEIFDHDLYKTFCFDHTFDRVRGHRRGFNFHPAGGGVI